jgi:hypothetical protein
LLAAFLVVMLGAGAWYAMYQNQEQARRSAQEYASQIDELEKSRRHVFVWTEIGKLLVPGDKIVVDEQAKKVGELKNQIDDLNASRKPGITSENDANMRAIAIVTDQLAVEEGLNDMRDKSRGYQQALRDSAVMKSRTSLGEAAVYQSMIMMNGQHTEFNRLLGLGNQLLMARQGWLTSRSDFLRPTSTKSKPMPSKRAAGIWSCHA